MSLRIEDYALIGDCQTAALVGNDGSIDWLCLPRFDAGACFASLLGSPDNGRWKISPASEVRKVRRHYWPETLILETEFTTDAGTVALIDFMPQRTQEADVVRIVEGRSGEVKMRMDLSIRFDYGWVIPWVQRLGDGSGISATAGPDRLHLRSPVKLRGENMHTVAEFTVKPGQRLPFKLTYTPTYGKEPGREDPEKLLKSTERWWKDWTGKCTHEGEWREHVVRSLIILKALTYAPTGGIVAAPTTSLPEHIGGVRNWDYRYCWIRDAAFALYGLLSGGYTEEAEAWREWLVHATAGTPEEIQIMYGVAGERRLTEHELDWLDGYEKSTPVRTGNAAFDQRQLDIYGELAETLHLGRMLGLEADERSWSIERAMTNMLLDAWKKPDEGIWEVRGPQQHFTHSKVMAWVAFDRAVKAVEEYGHKGEADRWAKARDEVHAEVLEKGFNRKVNAFTQFYGSDAADASLLMLPLVGFLPATDPRMASTIDFIRKKLSKDGFIERYDTEEGVDGLPGDEGTFLLCTFWLVDNLALQGKKEEARELFERLLSVQNDVGLLAEQYDPEERRQLGNYPQAFSHIGLINSAAYLAKKGGPAIGPPELPKISKREAKKAHARSPTPDLKDEAGG